MLFLLECSEDTKLKGSPPALVKHVTMDFFLENYFQVSQQPWQSKAAFHNTSIVNAIN